MFCKALPPALHGRYTRIVAIKQRAEALGVLLLQEHLECKRVREPRFVVLTLGKMMERKKHPPIARSVTQLDERVCRCDTTKQTRRRWSSLHLKRMTHTRTLGADPSTMHTSLYMVDISCPHPMIWGQVPCQGQIPETTYWRQGCRLCTTT